MTTAEVDNGRVLFDTAMEAVQWALSITGSPDKPSMNSYIDGVPLDPPRGLGGYDGAGQAGIIRSHMRRLGKSQFEHLLFNAILIASAAPHYIACTCGNSCCSKKKPNREWEEALNALGRYAFTFTASRASYRLRNLILRDIYDEPRTKKKIADMLEIDRETVTRHHRIISNWLMRPRTDPKETKEAPLPLLQAYDIEAWKAIDAALRSAKIVGG